MTQKRAYLPLCGGKLEKLENFQGLQGLGEVWGSSAANFTIRLALRSVCFVTSHIPNACTASNRLQEDDFGLLVEGA